MGQPRLSREERPGSHIAELSAVAAAPLVSRGPSLPPPPLPPCRSRDIRRRRAAPRPHSGREGAARSRGKPPAPYLPPLPFPGFAGDAEVAARSFGAQCCPAAAPRGPRCRYPNSPAGQAASGAAGAARLCPSRGCGLTTPVRASPPFGRGSAFSVRPGPPPPRARSGSRRSVAAPGSAWLVLSRQFENTDLSLGKITFCHVGKEFITTSSPRPPV